MYAYHFGQQELEPDWVSLLKLAGRVASKVRIYGMDYQDRRQEVLWLILFNLDKIRLADNPEGMAYTIAHRHLIKAYHRHKKFGQWPVSALKTVPGPGASDGGPDERPVTEKLAALAQGEEVAAFWRSEKMDSVTAKLHDGLDQLDQRGRIILRGFYGFEGKPQSIRQLADLLGLSPDYVKELKGGALEKLRMILEASAQRKVA